MLIADAITACEYRLRDTSNARWSEAELTAHINHGLVEYSMYIPLAEVVETIDAAQRMDISGVTGLIRVTAVEWASGQYPRQFQGFDMESDQYVFLDAEGSFSGKAFIYYDGERAIGDVVPDHESAVCDLACAFALEDYAANTTNKANVGETERFRVMAGDWRKAALGQLVEAQFKREMGIPVKVLVKHRNHALEDYSHYVPFSDIDSNLDAARTITVSGLTGLIKVTGVGFPKAQYPPRMRSFSPSEDNTKVLLQFPEPAGGWSGKVDIYYDRLRVSSEVLPTHQEVVDKLAEAYALEDYASLTRQYSNAKAIEARMKQGAELKAWALGRLDAIRKEREGG